MLVFPKPLAHGGEDGDVTFVRGTNADASILNTRLKSRKAIQRKLKRNGPWVALFEQYDKVKGVEASEGREMLSLEARLKVAVDALPSLAQSAASTQSEAALDGSDEEVLSQKEDTVIGLCTNVCERVAAWQRCFRPGATNDLELEAVRACRYFVNKLEHILVAADTSVHDRAVAMTKLEGMIKVLKLLKVR